LSSGADYVTANFLFSSSYASTSADGLPSALGMLRLQTPLESSLSHPKIFGRLLPHVFLPIPAFVIRKGTALSNFRNLP
jgi:hypothetical protein